MRINGQSGNSSGWKTFATAVPVVGILLPVLLLAAGCTSTYLDRRVESLTRDKAVEETAVSGETVSDAAKQYDIPDFPPGVTLSLNSTSVLQVAARYSRELQSRRDELYRSALSLFGTRRNFGFNVDGTIEYVFAGGDEAEDTESGTAALSIRRILPTGGRLQLSGRQDLDRAEDGSDTYSGTASASVEQPLLAGAGYRASHEGLTQAEREFVYGLRSFALQRQDFSIQILRDYYGLLSQRKVVDNTSTNYLQFVYLRERSEALFKVNRAPAIDVLRSQQEELSALNRLTSTRESFQIQLARFNITLGLSEAVETKLEDDIPPLREIVLDEEQAIALALWNRLDLMTRRDRVEDARRKLTVARNLYLPEVSLFGSTAYTADEAESISDQDYENTWQAGVRADIPIDRRDERDAVRVARLNLDSAERALTEFEENVVLEVREGYSRLRSLSVSVQIQLKNIEIAERRAENALLRFRNGSLSNRDVVEASNDLLDARNAYINALTDYEIQRLTLLRRIGLLDVSRDGGIIELTPEV